MREAEGERGVQGVQGRGWDGMGWEESGIGGVTASHVPIDTGGGYRANRGPGALAPASMGLRWRRRG